MYKPNDDVLDKLRGISLTAVVGPTAVGKSTVMRAAIKQDPSLRYVVFTTSRPPRPQEKDGVDYHFKTREEMEARIVKGEYVNVAPEVLGGLYASAPEDFTTEGVSITAVLAATVPTFRKLPFQNVRVIYILPPDWQTWHERIERHGFTPEQFERRMSEAKQSLEFGLQDHDTHFLISRANDPGVEDFIRLARGEPPTTRQWQDQQLAREIIKDLLAKLQAFLAAQ